MELKIITITEFDDVQSEIDDLIGEWEVKGFTSKTGKLCILLQKEEENTTRLKTPLELKAERAQKERDELQKEM